MTRRHPLRRRLRAERGAQLVEFALVLPLLLLVTGGIVDFGLMLNAWQVVTNAAREGARFAAVHGAVDETAVQARVEQYVTAGGLQPGVADTDAVAISVEGAGSPFPAAQVEVTYDYSLLMLQPVSLLVGPVLPSPSITLRANATMRLEGAAAQ